MRGNVAQETQGPRLIAAFTPPASERHGAVGAGAGVLDLVREQIRVTELGDAERVIECLGDPDRLLAVSFSLVEFSEVGEGARQVSTRHDSGKDREVKPFTNRLVM